MNSIFAKISSRENKVLDPIQYTRYTVSGTFTVVRLTDTRYPERLLLSV